jgi:hypothetical protein
MPVSLPVGEQHRPQQGAMRASLGFSYSDTDHYYIGTERDDATETNVAPATLGVETVLGLEYDLGRAFTVVGEIPFVHSEQSREFGGVAGTMKAHGLGDVRLLARTWLAPSWYVSVGLRLPTGEYDTKFRAKNGTLVTQDLAAQAGTGNPAGIVEIGGSRGLGSRLSLTYSARYVVTPSATTVNNFRHELTGNGPAKNSDSDSFNARLALAVPFGTMSPLGAQLVTDFAMVPYDDLIGDTEGFRRAGPIVTVGPGLRWAPPGTGMSFAAAVPITVYRDVQRNGGNVQEWMVQFAVGYQLGGID